MEDKYYTPELSEFYIGFDHEMLVDTNGFKYWVPYTWTIDFDIKLLSDCIIKELVRVKYLDTEDILEVIGWKDEGAAKISGETGLAETERIWTYKGLFIHYDSSRPHFIQIYDSKGYLYRGQCKNKSKLKQILKDINI
jgi:hypothetical protein